MRLITMAFALMLLIFLSSCGAESGTDSKPATKLITYTVFSPESDYINLDDAYVYLHDSNTGKISAGAKVDEQHQVSFEIDKSIQELTLSIGSLKPYQYGDGAVLSTYIDLPIDFTFLQVDGGEPQKSSYAHEACKNISFTFEFNNLPADTSYLIIDGNPDSTVSPEDLAYIQEVGAWQGFHCGGSETKVFEAMDVDGNKLSYGFIQIDEVQDGTSYPIDMSWQHELIDIAFSSEELPEILWLESLDIPYVATIDTSKLQSQLLLPTAISDNNWGLIFLSNHRETGDNSSYWIAYPVEDINDLGAITWNKRSVSYMVFDAQSNQLTWQSDFAHSDATHVSFTGSDLRWSLTIPEHSNSLTLPDLPELFKEHIKLEEADIRLEQVGMKSQQPLEGSYYEQSSRMPDGWLEIFIVGAEVKVQPLQLSGL